MRLNIFKIPTDEVEQLRAKLRDRKMEIIKSVEQAGWKGDFYFSKEPDPSDIPWVETFQAYFDDDDVPQNLSYYAAFVFTLKDRCFAISFGKSHFYLRPYSDFDFGIELAKRIADEGDIKQTASKRFQGRNKKNIRSYTADTRLDIQSGEAVDYLQSAVVPASRPEFGSAGKFGTSAQLTLDIPASGVGDVLNLIETELKKPARFKLPRTTLISDGMEEAKYDDMLVDELLAPKGASDLTHNTYDLYGIDFIFSNNSRFKIRCWGYPEAELDDLNMGDLKTYVQENKVRREDILRIKIVHFEENRPVVTKPIKEAVDFIADDDRVVLVNGRWMRFNQDYLEFLDEYLASIAVEVPEDEFAQVSGGEPAFNKSDEVSRLGYGFADKDFSIFRTRSSTPVEAWDLRRGDRVYAVKFGTPQKLGYVCDQAINLLELLRNKAGVNEVPDFREYCLWLGYKSKKPLNDITDSGSIILKQKIETWARKARELGIEPILKISQRV